MQNKGYYKKVNQHLYATKYRDFCLKGGDEDFSLRLSEFNLLFYLGTSEQEEMAQKFIKHLEQKIHMQILMLKVHNEINKYESNNSTGS